MENELETKTITSIHEHEQLYDVFLSFRGSDTRLSFTGNLFNALRNKRFKTFMDNDSLKSGNQILASIFKALERSKIAIVVLSKDYASSPYCLDELAKIVECREREDINLLVFPVFYDVDPSDVRYQTGKFGYGFDSLQRRFQREPDERLQKWKSALSQVGCINGWHFQKRDLQKCEYDLIQEIVEFVSKTLSRYDVYLSFNEEDTRYSFSGYLYNALDREGFKIFMKDTICQEKNKGQSSHSLVTTIEKSRLSIIVLSKNYAYSSSCLDELVTILDFVKNNQLLVWPIFYKVEPSDIRHQKNSYEKAMNEHENKYGKDSEKVKKWRSALFEVANLRGWHLKYGYEYELIEKIVDTAIKI